MMDKGLLEGYAVRRPMSPVRSFVTLCAAACILSGNAWAQVPIGNTAQRVITRFSGPGNDISDPNFAEDLFVKSIQESATSVGSYVGKARATPGSVGAESYLGYIEGLDTYGGQSKAYSATTVDVTGPANGTATLIVGGHINGGMGIFGSDAHAAAKAWYSFNGAQNIRLPSGATSLNYVGPVFGRTLDARDLFWDKAAPDDTRTFSEYDYSPRQDFRLIDVPLDPNGNGSFWMQLSLETEAYEDGEEELTIFAAASDFFNTVNGFLEPMDAAVSITPASPWQVNAFGTSDPFTPISPAPNQVDVSGITSLPLSPDVGSPAIPAPTATAGFMTAIVLYGTRRRPRNAPA